MKMFCLIFLSIFTIVVDANASQDTVYDSLVSAKSLKCQFGLGSSGSWSGSKLVVEQNRFDVTFHFDSIDIKTHKARLIANQGADDVTVLASGTGITFIEQTGAGNFMFTTVFFRRIEESDEFYAVTSRHFIGFGPPLPSQYHGKCKVWQ